MTEGIDFVILHTNDVHSVFESMPRIRSFFSTYEREQPRERLLRFDIGDHMDRARPETEGSMGAANIAVMNATGYDAAVPGNNEGLTIPAPRLDELYGQLAQFPVTVANLRPADPLNLTGASWIRPRIVLERAGIRFGVFGLTAAFSMFYKELGWEASDPFAAAREQVERLRSEDRVDVVIVLSHLGIRDDRRLAQEVPGIDLVLGAHTHHVIPELERVGDAYIGAAGKFGSHVGVVRLVVDPWNRKLVSCEGGAVELFETAPTDASMEMRIAGLAGDAATALDRVVARLPRSLPADPEGESVLGNLLAMALRRHCGADIGIVNSGQLLHGLSAGLVTAAELHEILPSPINPCFMQLRGQALRQAIVESMAEERRRFSFRGFGFRGKVLGALCVDGITVCTSKRGTERRVEDILVSGMPLDDDRWYRVGTIDMFTFRIGYESLAQGRDIAYRLPEFLRDILAETLAAPGLDTRIVEAEKSRYVNRSSK